MSLTKFFLLFGLLVSSVTKAESKSSCTYSPDTSTLLVQWTAFKTTQKVAVPGKFIKSKSIKKIEKSYTSLSLLLKAAAVEVDMLSSDSGNPPRDMTLKNSFFSLLKDKSVATGSLTNIKELENKSGTADMILKFNGQTKKVPVTFAYSDSSVIVKGSFDVLNFTASEALNSLNKACLELHKGSDGVSKTWSEVNFTASVKAAETCQ